MMIQIASQSDRLLYLIAPGMAAGAAIFAFAVILLYLPRHRARADLRGPSNLSTPTPSPS